jgi:Flp pilus assembly protein TadD
MVQWATGKYVEAWTRELQPYFENYNYVSPSDRQAGKAHREAEAHNARGIAQMRQGKYEAAGGEFSAADLLEPGNAEYLNNLGYASYKDEDYETAVRFLGEAMEVDPKRAIAYLNRGNAFAKLQRYAEARKDYVKFLELAPDSKSAPDVKRKLDAMPRTP